MLELSPFIFLIGEATEKASNHRATTRKYTKMEKLDMALFSEMPCCSSPTSPSGGKQ
jgi:hypothetical protein